LIIIYKIAEVHLVAKFVENDRIFSVCATGGHCDETRNGERMKRDVQRTCSEAKV